MDDAAHKHRKQLFMSLMTPERLRELKDITAKQWKFAVDSWQQKQKFELFHEAEKVMCRIACEWAGVPLFASELNQRTSDFSAMIDAFGAVGPRHWSGRTARNRSERWIRTIIDQVRNGERTPPEDTALYAMAWHRDLNGNLLDLQVAAVELINILRPIVAIGRYITFGALAMHDFRKRKRNCKWVMMTTAGCLFRKFAAIIRLVLSWVPGCATTLTGAAIILKRDTCVAGCLWYQS